MFQDHPPYGLGTCNKYDSIVFQLLLTFSISFGANVMTIGISSAALASKSPSAASRSQDFRRRLRLRRFPEDV